MSQQEKPSNQSHYFSDQTPATDAELTHLNIDLGPFPARIATARGVFSHDHLDTATAILLRTLDAQARPFTFATAADVGCGWGPISLYLALARATDQDNQSAQVLAVDVNDRALDLTRRNAEAIGTSAVRTLRPEQFEAGTELDLIASNPPIRIGKAALHDLLSLWLPRLRVGGAAFLVVAKQLGADSLLRWLADRLAETAADPMVTATGVAVVGEVSRVETAKGFRVIRVERTA